MLSLTRKTDYALVALAHLCQCREAGEPAVSARRIADQFGLPLPLLMNILKELAQAKIVKSTRGPQGGYTLGRDPARVSLLEVVTATEGPIRVVECADDLPILGQGCRLSSGCLIREPIKRLHDRINDFLAQVSLADLLDCKVNVPVNQVGVESASITETNP